jgi:arginyl-tRNA synthetase
VNSTLERFKEAGVTQEKDDGSLWFVSTRFGDDKDRVLVRGDGTPTYFASDIAYHADKVARGFDRLIDVLGADHHGYVARLRGALSTVDFPKERFEVLLYQLVSLLRDGKAFRMGKRLGNLITIEEVLDEIDSAAGRKGAGADALRYYYLSRRTETPIELDIEVAKKQSLDNPVFYLQYGHARLCAVLRRAKEKFDLEPEPWNDDFSGALTHPDELGILLTLGRFPGVVEEAARERAPHKIVFYLQDLSQAYQSYYTRLKTERDPMLPQARDMAEEGWEQNWNLKFHNSMKDTQIMPTSGA